MKMFEIAVCSLWILGLSLAIGWAQESTTGGGDEAEKPLPPRLQKMIDTYERERARLLTPVEAKYTQALEQLKVQLTKSGDIKGVVEVKALLAARRGESVDEADKDEENEDSKLKIANTKWKWGETSGILELKHNGVANHTSWGSAPGHWERVTDDIVKMTSPGTTFIVHFLPNGTAIVTSAVGSSVTLSPLH